LVTSIGLADVIADAVGIARESAQLHQKTIRAAGQITFKGYGRAAASMAPLDASRLLIAVAGSTFAKDSLKVLRRFASLKPVSDPRDRPLEEFLAYRIELLSGERRYIPNDRTPAPLRRLPQIAMELMWPADVHSENLLPCGESPALRHCTMDNGARGHPHADIRPRARATRAQPSPIRWRNF
jgi:hypothetical protein